MLVVMSFGITKTPATIVNGAICNVIPNHSDAVKAQWFLVQCILSCVCGNQ